MRVKDLADLEQLGALQTTSKKIRLKMALPSAFIILICFAGLFIVTINYFLAASSMRDFAHNYINEVSQHTLEKTLSYLKPATRVARLDAELMSNEKENPTSLEFFNNLTINELKNFKQFAQIYYGDKYGCFWMNARNHNGTISTQFVERIDDSPVSRDMIAQARRMPRNTAGEKAAVSILISPYVRTVWKHRDIDGKLISTDEDRSYPYDPRLRPWYINTRKRKTLSWTGAYLFSSSGRLYASGKPGVTVSAPVYVNNEIEGIVGVDIVLEELSSFLKNLEIGQNGRAFIIDSDGTAIALPAYKDISTKSDKAGFSLNSIEDVSDKEMVESFYELHRRLDSCPYNPIMLEDEILFSFISDGERYFGFYSAFPVKSGLDWLIGVVVPERDFLGKARRNIFISLAASLLLIALVIWISLYFTSEVTNPVNRIALEARRIKNFDLEGGVEADSMFAELEQLSMSFGNMLTGLKSFQKYVPADVVRYLIDSGEEAVLGGKGRNLTIFFSDVADFTQIAENMPPRELVLHLGSYMDNLSRIILNNNGTVDKYIGDAVMAFWNAPQTVEDHAASACRAALEWKSEQQALNDEWRRQGLPVLYTRIGINTGEVIVGNMGSEERLNYTVIGDAVNLASRLEALGKRYGVDIIIAENTFLLAQDAIEIRRLDKVAVKGKKEGVFIYELVSLKGELADEESQFVNLYELALEAYFSRQWKMAGEMFTRALNLKPKDKSAQLFINRCRLYNNSPPPDDWDGTFVLTKK